MANGGAGRSPGQGGVGDGPGPEAASRRTIVREMRGIPFFLLREYLEELGGTATDDGLVEGDGWTATLEKMEPFRIGSLSVGQTKVTLEIEDHLVDDFMGRFSMKTLSRWKPLTASSKSIRPARKLSVHRCCKATPWRPAH